MVFSPFPDFSTLDWDDDGTETGGGTLFATPVALAQCNQEDVRVREIWLAVKHMALQIAHYKSVYFPFEANATEYSQPFLEAFKW